MKNQLNQLRVLIIDDSTLFIQSIRGLLTKLKFDERNIQHAYDTKLATWYLKDRIESALRFDIIICSYSFKNKPNAKHFFNHIENAGTRGHLTALIVTDNSLDRQTIRNIDEFMPDGFIAKPFNKSYFFTQFRQIINRSIALKPLRNAYYQYDYGLVLELADEYSLRYPQFHHAIQRIKSMALAKLKRFDEAITICEAELNKNSEWAVVNLVEYLSLVGSSQKVSDRISEHPDALTHQKVTTIMTEMDISIDRVDELIAKYNKKEDDHEQKIKGCLLPLLQLDYHQTIQLLSSFVRNNKNNPLLDSRCLLLLKGLLAINDAVNQARYSDESTEDIKSTTPTKQQVTYEKILYLVNKHHLKQLFKTQQRLEKIRKQVWESQDNFLLLLYVTLCFQFGLDEKVIEMGKELNHVLNNDRFAIIVRKITLNFVNKSEAKLKQEQSDSQLDLASLVVKTKEAPLSRIHHENVIDKAVATLKGKEVQRVNLVYKCVAISIVYLKELYMHLKDNVSLEKLKSNYRQIRLTLR